MQLIYELLIDQDCFKYYDIQYIIFLKLCNKNIVFFIDFNDFFLMILFFFKN